MQSKSWSSILQCPETGLALEEKEDGFATEKGWPRYPVIDGIPRVRNMRRLAASTLEGIQGIVFDFDDTLIKSEAIKQDGFKVVAEAHGISSEQMQEIQKEEMGRSRFEIFQSLVEKFGLEHVGVEDLVGEYAAYCEERIVRAPEVEGALPFVKTASRHMPCFVSSATPHEALQKTLERLGWEGHFEGIYGYPTPKNEVILEVAQRLQTGPEKVLMAGDLERDWEAAGQAGCRFLGIGEGMLRLGHLRGFPVVLNWAELNPVLPEAWKHAE